MVQSIVMAVSVVVSPSGSVADRMLNAMIGWPASPDWPIEKTHSLSPAPNEMGVLSGLAVTAIQ